MIKSIDTAIFNKFLFWIQINKIYQNTDRKRLLSSTFSVVFMVLTHVSLSIYVKAVTHINNQYDIFPVSSSS
jgi:hypothetical protein